MKGYDVPDGHMGYLPSIGKYKLFSTEEEYAEYFRENEESK